MKVAFDRIISKLDRGEESLSEWEDMTMKLPKSKRKKEWAFPNLKIVGEIQQVQHMRDETPETERRKEQKQYPMQQQMKMSQK